MRPSTKHRSSLYRSLSPLVGDEEADALLSQFPASETNELVTQQFLRAELAETRLDLHELLRRHIVWTVGLVVTAMGVQTAVLSLLS